MMEGRGFHLASSSHAQPLHDIHPYIQTCSSLSPATSTPHPAHFLLPFILRTNHLIPAIPLRHTIETITAHKVKVLILLLTVPQDITKIPVIVHTSMRIEGTPPIVDSVSSRAIDAAVVLDAASIRLLVFGPFAVFFFVILAPVVVGVVMVVEGL